MTTPLFIRLTSVFDGQVICINANHIAFFRATEAEGKTFVYIIEDSSHSVTESVDEVMRKINGEGSES